MTKQIEKDVEEQVIADRAGGMSYAALEEKYKEHGVTVKWAKRVCKDLKVVKVVSSPQKAIAAVYPLAVRPIGVKPSEYFPILRECYGLVYDEEAGYEKLNMTPAQKSYLRSKVKEKAQKEGKEAHFIPEWLDRADPAYCNSLMLQCAQSLYDAFEEQVGYFLQTFPDLAEGRGKGYSIRNELFSLVVRGYDPAGVHKRCERNMEAVEFLAGNRDLPLTPSPSPKQVAEEIKLDKEAETVQSLNEWDSILKDLGY